MSIYVILKLSVTIYSNHLLTFVNCKYTKMFMFVHTVHKLMLTDGTFYPKNILVNVETSINED